MHRLFVALRPPPALRQRLIACMGGIPQARWQDDDQLHLTLRFIGEVERPQAEDIAAILGSVTHPRPSIAVRGVGLFGRAGAPHTLWADVAPDPALSQLQQRCDQALVLAGIARDGRAFTPHITLARFPRGAPPPTILPAGLAGLASPAYDMSHFLLYESSLGHAGATYSAIARYPLA
jgi:RNA 2',3'-cyclic 3'-phosphodiesterase